MNWSWITPPIAAALAGAIGAVGALIGAVVTGAINSRNTKRQIEAQTQIALQQLQSQERIAEANRAEQRAQTLLGERRVLYGQVVEHGSLIKYWAHRQVATTRKLAANDIRDAAKEWNAANQEGLPEEAWSDAAVSYGERVDVQHRLREEVSQLRPLLAALDSSGPLESRRWRNASLWTPCIPSFVTRRRPTSSRRWWNKPSMTSSQQRIRILAGALEREWAGPGLRSGPARR